MPKDARVPQGPVQVDDGGVVVNRMKRPQRRSFDELLTRNATFGAGLNELDDILNDDVVKSIGAQQRGLKERAAPTAAGAAPLRLRRCGLRHSALDRHAFGRSSTWVSF